MDPEPQTLNLANATETGAPPDNAPEALIHFERRGNGKIARLPKPIRDQVNQMILDGLTYPEIIQCLAENGKDLTPRSSLRMEKTRLPRLAPPAGMA